MDTGASRLAAKHSTSISIVCRDTYDRLLYSKGKSIGDRPILLEYTLAIPEGVTNSIQVKHSLIIIQSDSQVDIKAILKF